MSERRFTEYRYTFNLQFQDKCVYNVNEIDEEETDSNSFVEKSDIELQRNKGVNNPKTNSEDYALKDSEFKFEGDAELVCESSSFDFNGSNDKILIKEVSSSVVEDVNVLDDIRLNQVRQTKPNKKRNVSFSKQESQRIEYENELLLRRIMAQQRPKEKFQERSQTCISTAEINRRKLQRKIEYDNILLLQKIRRAKPHVITKGKQPGFRMTIF
ncbi:hypothetical protein KM043_016919 [Ampulex compressa]|nr:hypothetical protein KM043_016919 [Ampulex compressa]